MRLKEFSHRLNRAFKAFWASEEPPPTNAAPPHSPEASQGTAPNEQHGAAPAAPINILVKNEVAPPKPGTWTQAPAPMAWQQQRAPAPQTWRQAPPMSANPGIQCPRCQTRFEVLIPVLLSGMPLSCPNCGLELKVNREKSEESLAALEKLHGNFEKATEMMDRAKGKT